MPSLMRLPLMTVSWVTDILRISSGLKMENCNSSIRRNGAREYAKLTSAGILTFANLFQTGDNDTKEKLHVKEAGSAGNKQRRQTMYLVKISIGEDGCNTTCSPSFDSFLCDDLYRSMKLIEGDENYVPPR